MKASELRPGQFFKFVDHAERYRRVKHESRCVYYIDAECQLHWCAPDLEVTAVAGWDDEPESDEYELIAIGDTLQEGDMVSFGASPDKRLIDEGYGTVILTQDYAKFWRRKAQKPVVKQSLATEPLQLQEGKYYERRDGEIVGPAEKSISKLYPWSVGDGGYTDNGHYNATPLPSRHDLIREVPPPVSANEWPPELVAQVEQKRQDDEGWVEHDGKSMPAIPAGSCTIMQFSDGSQEPTYTPQLWRWIHTGRSDDITHYRVVEPDPATYRPFANAEEFRIHRDRWLRYKHSAVTARVSWVRHDMVEIGKHAIYWRTLFHDYVFDDNNEPCGVRE